MDPIGMRIGASSSVSAQGMLARRCQPDGVRLHPKARTLTSQGKETDVLPGRSPLVLEHLWPDSTLRRKTSPRRALFRRTDTRSKGGRTDA